MNSQFPTPLHTTDQLLMPNDWMERGAQFNAEVLPPNDDEIIEDEGAEIDDDDEDDEDDENVTLYGDEDMPLEDDYGSGDVRDIDYIEDEDELDNIIEPGDEEKDNLRDAADEHVRVEGEDEDEEDYEEDEEVDDDLDVEL
jgi:hypothetical protein